MRSTVAATLFVFSLSAGAHAEGFGKPCTAEPQSKWLSLEAIEKVVTDHGYKVSKSKLKGTCVEIYARDPKGGKIEFFIDPATGNPVGTTWGDNKYKKS